MEFDSSDFNPDHNQNKIIGSGFWSIFKMTMYPKWKRTTPKSKSF